MFINNTFWRPKNVCHVKCTTQKQTSAEFVVRTAGYFDLERKKTFMAAQAQNSLPEKYFVAHEMS